MLMYLIRTLDYLCSQAGEGSLVITIKALQRERGTLELSLSSDATFTDVKVFLICFDVILLLTDPSTRPRSHSNGMCHPCNRITHPCQPLCPPTTLMSSATLFVVALRARITHLLHVTLKGLTLRCSYLMAGASINRATDSNYLPTESQMGSP